MSWFKRIKEGITTSTRQKKETPEGLWHKCNNCKKIIPFEDHKKNYFVCSYCDHHERISSNDYINIICEKKSFTELFKEIKSIDPLNFEDKISYSQRLQNATKKTGLDDAVKTGLDDAVKTGIGKIGNDSICLACMDFDFIGGSMGSVVGEKISKLIDVCIKKRYPLIIISKSGGARMMEAALSLMQLAKTSAKLHQLSENKIPYISLLTDPTFGGATASFSMLGDVNIAEPKALIGFAGPRVVKETIGKDLPKGFQTSEFLLEKGFLDFIVHRKDLKVKIKKLLVFFKN